MLKHLLRITDLSGKDVDLIMRTAALSRIWPIDEAFAHEPAAIMMLEASNRTANTFQLAMRRLGMEPLNFNTGTMETKNETLFDCVHTLSAMGCHIIVIRDKEEYLPARVADVVPEINVINAGDGIHAHPTQALGDLFTLLMDGRFGTEFEDFMGLRLVLLGDVKHSRVAHSVAQLFSSLGAVVIAAGPESMMPAREEPDLTLYGVHEVHYNVDDALKGAHIVMPLRAQLERHLAAGKIIGTRDFLTTYGLTVDRMRLTHPDAVIMAPGPVNPGIEISHSLVYGEKSLIKRQVANHVPVRAAIIHLLRSGKLYGEVIHRACWG